VPLRVKGLERAIFRSRGVTFFVRPDKLSKEREISSKENMEPWKNDWRSTRSCWSRRKSIGAMACTYGALRKINGAIACGYGAAACVDNLSLCSIE
jgi:hypothetical protein